MPAKSIRLLLTVLIFLVSMALGGCRAAEKNKQEPQLSPENQAKSRLGVKYTVDYNVSKTYALYQQQRENDHSGRKFKYIVVRLKDNKITHEGSFSMGYVKWLDDKSIEVLNSSIRNDSGGEKKIITVNSNQP
jgi:hypothetical protein